MSGSKYQDILPILCGKCSAKAFPKYPASSFSTRAYQSSRYYQKYDKNNSEQPCEEEQTNQYKENENNVETSESTSQYQLDSSITL